MDAYPNPDGPRMTVSDVVALIVERTGSMPVYGLGKQIDPGDAVVGGGRVAGFMETGDRGSGSRMASPRRSAWKPDAPSPARAGSTWPRRPASCRRPTSSPAPNCWGPTASRRPTATTSTSATSTPTAARRTRVPPAGSAASGPERRTIGTPPGRGAGLLRPDRPRVAGRPAGPGKLPATGRPVRRAGAIRLSTRLLLRPCRPSRPRIRLGLPHLGGASGAGEKGPGTFFRMKKGSSD